MIYIVSVLGVMALLSGTAAVIFITLRDQADAIVAALAGRSIRAEAMAVPTRRVRVTFRTPMGRPVSLQPLRAAA